MMFLHSALVAGLATIGQAILLPPSASSADADIANTLPFEAKSGAEGQTLDLECRHCPVPTKQQNELKWISDVESKLQLQFEIVESELDTLQLNGVQIYPPHDLPLEPIGAPQITQETLLNDYTVFLNLGYELDITPAMKSENDQLELILVRFQVVEIAGRFVDGLDSVLLKLLKTPNGKLMIGDLGTGPTINPGGKDCQTLICQIKKIVTGKLSHLKPKKGCGSKAAPVKGHPHGHGGHSSEHGSEHGTHRHHRHHGLSRFLHALKRAAFHVLIPVLIGIAAGFTASLLGMLVGQTAVFLWRTFYRRGRKGPYSRVERNEMETDEKDQKKSLLEHQDPPPVYEDVVEDVKLME